MNKRIKELIQIADLCAAGLMASGASEEEIQNRSKVILAGLIVRECADILDNQIAPSNHLMNSLGHKLKQHFGAEL
jgi:hypothetical protein